MDVFGGLAYQCEDAGDRPSSTVARTIGSRSIITSLRGHPLLPMFSLKETIYVES